MGKVVSPSMETGSGGKGPLVKSTLAAALAAAFSLSAGVVDAAGLGRLTVQSGLGQPLQAEVEITALTREEAASLSARLAPPEAFTDAGLEFNPALTGLRFEIQQRGGAQPVVEIRSLRPINEPFIDLLIELNWATGKFVREYTFLLDPPELQLGRAAPQELSQPVAPAVGSSVAQRAPDPFAATPGSGTQSAARPVPEPAAPAAPQVNAPQVAASPAPSATPSQDATPSRAAAPSQPVGTPRRLSPLPPPQQPAVAGAPTRRTVERGDTLAEIAESVRPANVSLDQAIVAIYRSNPDAFFGSVHQLRAGSTLTIPGAIEMAQVTEAGAREEIARSNQVFRDYRARIAESARDAGGVAAVENGSGAATAAVGQIGDAPAPVTETRPQGDQLELSRDAPADVAGTDATSSTGDSSAANAEGAIARDIALRNAQQRVTELERNVADLQRLLELKNKQLSDLSRQADFARAGVGEPSAPTPASPMAPMTPMADAGANGATASPVAPGSVEPAANTTTPVPGESAGDAGNGRSVGTESVADSAAAAQTPSGESALATRAESAVELARRASEAYAPPPVAPRAAAPAAAAPVAAEPEGMMDTLRQQVLGNPYVPAGIAVLLGLVGLFAWKRRRSADAGDDSLEDTLGSDEAFTSNSLFGTTGGQDVDTNQSLFHTAGSDSEAGVDVHSTEVDPIAEAEVYIAYGREAQAEEILKEALKRQPERQAIRLKLLEIYAGRKDATTYAHLAREMYDQTGGQNEEWPKVITMGLAIDPDNPLYTGDGEPPARGGVAAGAAAGLAGAALADEGLGERTDYAEDASLADVDAAVGELEGALSRSPFNGGEAAADRGAASESSLESSETLGSASVGGMSLGDDSEILDQDTMAAADDELGALDFDLDTLGDASDDTMTLSGADTSAAGGLDMPGLSLDLDDTTTVDSGLAAPSLASSRASREDFGLSPASVLGGAEALSDDMSDLGLDIPSIDTLSGAAGAESGDVDLSSIGLDLAPATEVGESAAQGDSARWQEMATKLDLASAYEEIGDREGARELLEEVVKGGDNAQQQKARAMLSKIS